MTHWVTFKIGPSLFGCEIEILNNVRIVQWRQVLIFNSVCWADISGSSATWLSPLLPKQQLKCGPGPVGCPLSSLSLEDGGTTVHCSTEDFHGHRISQECWNKGLYGRHHCWFCCSLPWSYPSLPENNLAASKTPGPLLYPPQSQFKGKFSWHFAFIHSFSVNLIQLSKLNIHHSGQPGRFT